MMDKSKRTAKKVRAKKTAVLSLDAFVRQLEVTPLAVFEDESDGIGPVTAVGEDGANLLKDIPSVFA